MEVRHYGSAVGVFTGGLRRARICGPVALCLENQDARRRGTMPEKSSTCFKKNGEPLSTYFSKAEADDGASYVNSQYGLDLSPYNCSTCGNWHLSPKDRQTQNTVCAYCIDSYGRHKALYETFEGASKRADIIRKERGITLNVYECPHQAGWHLTKGGF